MARCGDGVDEGKGASLCCESRRLMVRLLLRRAEGEGDEGCALPCKMTTMRVPEPTASQQGARVGDVG